MNHDVVDLRDFYGTPLGQTVRRVLRPRLRALWPTVRGMRVLGVGYATPFLNAFREDAERLLAFMPAEQGVTDWPPGQPTLTALVEGDMWPLADDMVERILAIHALETAVSPPDLFREIWRTLAPEGRLLLVVPSRRGLWARFETTPFGHGHPYSRSQLSRLLSEAGFVPLSWSEALFFPPIQRPLILGSARGFERMGAQFWPLFAGVHIVDAKKQVPRPVSGRKVRVARIKPALVPAGALAPGN